MGEEFGFSVTFDSAEELLDSPGWDALLICSDHEHLFPHLKQALPDGRPILVEKPVAFSSHEVEQLLGHANEHVAVAYNRRHYASSREARNFLRCNRRAVVTVEIPEFVDREDGMAPRSWQNVLTNSVHMFDLAGFITGGLGEVLYQSLEAPALADGSVQLRRSEEGNIVILKMIWNSPANFSISLEASGERYVLSPIEIGTRYSGMQVVEPTTSVPVRRYVPIALSSVIASRNYSTHKPGFVEQMHAFKSLVRGNGRTQELATLADAAAALLIAESVLGA